MTSTFDSRTQSESDQIGSDIQGRNSTSQFGYSVDINFAEDRIVASGIEYSSYKGYIGIWNLVNGAWVQYGSYIDGPETAGKFGHSVSMNYAGTRILVGAPDVNRVYVLDDNGSGFTITQTIYRSGSTSFGYTVSLAADRGLRFAVGAPDDGSGKVYVYEKTTNGANGFTLSYTDDGSDIYNNVPFSSSNYVRLNNSFNRYGHSVHMAAFGRHYIAGMPGTRKESYPSSDHSGTANYNNIVYSSNINTASDWDSVSQWSSLLFYYNDPNYISNGRPKHQVRYPQYQVGYIRVKRCPDGGNWTSGVTTVGGTTSTSSGNGGVGTIKGPNDDANNNIGSWDDYQGNSFGGFGSAVQISPKGDKISISAPGWYNNSFTDSHSGRILYYEYDTTNSNNNWVENIQPNYNTFIGGQHGYALTMGSDSSRIFASNFDARYALIPYDFSGSEWYRAGYILNYGGVNGNGRYQGFSMSTKSGKAVVMGSIGMGTSAGRFVNRYGVVNVWSYALTSVFRGNSLFEGYIKAEEMVIGSTTNNTNTKRLLFGGTKGDNIPNVSSMEVRHLGTSGDRDSEILISKWYGAGSDGAMGVPWGSSTNTWSDSMSSDRLLYGDRLRLKAPKIEFHLQPSNAYYDDQKYSEHPIVTITSQDPGLYGSTSYPPRFLTNIRSGSTTSTKYAGLRLTSASGTTWNGSTHGMPADGDYYTFSPANDGWLRLYGGASGQGNMSGNYAGLQVGNLYVNGTISGPGAPSGGGTAITNPVAIGTGSGASGQGTRSTAVGYYSGTTNQSYDCVAIGSRAGNSTQGLRAVAIGNHAGGSNQGSYAVAIGYVAGRYTQPSNSFYVSTYSIRSGGGSTMYYNTSTGEVYRASSDDRVKHDETYIASAMNSLCKLRPQEYLKRQKLDINDPEQEWTYEAGLMAQEIYYSAPELRHIVNVPDEAGDIENYTPPLSDDPTQDPDYSAWGDAVASVDYIQLIPYLVKATQEIVTELPRSKTTVSNTWNQLITGFVVSANTDTHKADGTPIVTLSNVAMDKSWYGIVSDKVTDTNDYDTLIDTKGDTRVWVTDVNGPLEPGDLLTTSNVALGHVQKQGDDIIRSYTVAKITQTCDFTEPIHRPKKIPRRELSNVTYYTKDTSYQIDIDKYETIPSSKTRVVENDMYFKEDEYASITYYHGDLEISESKYNTLTDDVRSTRQLSEIAVDAYDLLTEEEKAIYFPGVKRMYFMVSESRSKTQIPQHDTQTVVREMVDVLDENGQIVWEETTITEPVYTLVDRGVYKAALVRCKIV